MSKPTRDQIIEGRDEALEHLGLVPVLWARRDVSNQRAVLMDGVLGSVSRAAALTVAIAEDDLTASPIARLGWLWLAVKLNVASEPRQSDYTLQA